MGIVYKANEKSRNRVVALKILPRQLAADESLLKRFMREARAHSSLNHPNIVPVYGVGEHKGTHFIAMEYVQGPTLAQILEQKNAFEIAEALRIVKEAANALREAHRQGMIHRDVKLSNIMLDPDGHAKVLDFGLARFAAETTQLTADGAKPGCASRKLIRVCFQASGYSSFIVMM